MPIYIIISKVMKTERYVGTVLLRYLRAHNFA